MNMRSATHEKDSGDDIVSQAHQIQVCSHASDLRVPYALKSKITELQAFKERGRLRNTPLTNICPIPVSIDAELAFITVR